MSNGVNSCPIRNRSGFMCGWKSFRRFLGLGVAVFLLVALGIGAAIVLFAGQSPFPAPSPGTDLHRPRKAKPMAPEVVTAIRNADAESLRQLLDGGADVNARDAEGNTPLILAS